MYWAVVPRQWRRTCLFKVSCSHHVYAATRAGGLLPGWRALVARWRCCRSGFHVELQPNGWQVHLADGTLADDQALADIVLAPYRQALASAQHEALMRVSALAQHGSTLVIPRSR